jgi:hypothetical protein
MIKSIITDPMTGIQAQVENGAEKNGLVVATRPLKTFENRLSFFTNADYGVNMNQNAAAGGTPEEIHDGIDSILWTGSNITGVTVVFNSVLKFHGGSQSVYANKPNTNDIWQFAKGSDVNLSGFVSLTIWIYIDNNWDLGESTSVYCWDIDTGTQVGNKVFLEDYFNFSDFDAWQKITIPLDDLGVSGTITVDAIRFQQEASTGIKPQYFLDDIQFEETGDPIIYTVKPQQGTWYYVDKFMIVYADVYNPVLTDSTMPKIPYDGWLGVGELDTGITYQRIKNGEPIVTTSIKRHLDMMNFSNGQVTGYGSDGTNSWVAINVLFPQAVILKAEDDDKMTMTVNDDLSGLLEFRISAGGYIENRK